MTTENFEGDERLINTNTDVFQRIKEVAEEGPDWLDKQVEKEFKQAFGDNNDS